MAPVRFALVLVAVSVLYTASAIASNSQSNFRRDRVVYTDAAEKDRIHSLPGWGQVPTGMFGGYITVSEEAGRALFYVFVESQMDPDNDPVILWLNGGPGCSSLGGGFMSELGPFYPEPDGRTLQENPYSWHKIGNVLFIESPAFVGFSYSNTSSDAYVGDGRTAKDSYQFLLGFFERFPHLKDNDFWISGESYAGHYVPNLAYTIVKGNEEAESKHVSVINLTGFMAGNPLTDTYTDNLGAVDFWWNHALISDDTLVGLKDFCDFDHVGPLKEADMLKEKEDKCEKYLEQYDQEMGSINIYEIFADVCLPARLAGPVKKLAELLPKNSAAGLAATKTMAGVERLRASRQALRASRQASTLSRKLLEQGALSIEPEPAYDPCVDNEVETYLNLPEVQLALHANQTRKIPGTWHDCSNAVFYSRSDLLSSMLPVYEDLVGRGLQILVYSGDVDGILPVVGTRRWVAGLGLKEVSHWRHWESESGQVAGYTVSYEGLTFTSIRNAGHMVPYTQPERAFAMVKRFTSGQPL